jgi:hypothetical protein
MLIPWHDTMANNQEPPPMLTPLEKTVLNAFLERPGEPFETIRHQLAYATVTRRAFEKNGFLAVFEIPKDAPVTRNLPNTTLSNVSAEIEGLRHGAGFLLLVRNGVLSKLEGFAYREEWPPKVDRFNVLRLS